MPMYTIITESDILFLKQLCNSPYYYFIFGCYDSINNPQYLYVSATDDCSVVFKYRGIYS